MDLRLAVLESSLAVFRNIEYTRHKMIPPPQNLNEFEALLEVVKALRSENGCPWDKEQTHQSLAPFAIEEAHEFAEAIEQNDRDEMVSELGDLLLQVALHSEIGRATTDPKMKFNIKDVIYAINEKMVRRHPHVFADASAKDADEVLKNWAEIKKLEKKKASGQKFDIPAHLPALMRSQKIGDKTKNAHFDWTETSQVIGKVEEELRELKEAIADRKNGPSDAIESELGDLLFTCAQLARHLKLDAEQALRKANQRFEKRFFKMFELAGPQPSAQELEKLWEQVKILEKQGQI